VFQFQRVTIPLSILVSSVCVCVCDMIWQQVHCLCLILLASSISLSVSGVVSYLCATIMSYDNEYVGMLVLVACLVPKEIDFRTEDLFC